MGFGGLDMSKVRARDRSNNIFVECIAPEESAEAIAREWQAQMPDLRVEVVRVGEK